MEEIKLEQKSLSRSELLATCEITDKLEKMINKCEKEINLVKFTVIKFSVINLIFLAWILLVVR